MQTRSGPGVSPHRTFGSQWCSKTRNKNSTTLHGMKSGGNRVTVYESQPGLPKRGKDKHYFKIWKAWIHLPKASHNQNRLGRVTMFTKLGETQNKAYPWGQQYRSKVYALSSQGPKFNPPHHISPHQPHPGAPGSTSCTLGAPSTDCWVQALNLRCSGLKSLAISLNFLSTAWEESHYLQNIKKYNYTKETVQVNSF